MHKPFWIGAALLVAAAAFKFLVPFSFGLGWRGKNMPLNFIAFWLFAAIGLAFLVFDAVKTLMMMTTG